MDIAAVENGINSPKARNEKFLDFWLISVIDIMQKNLLQ